jgi:hypothetical protein
MSEIPVPEIIERLNQTIENIEARLTWLLENLGEEKANLANCKNDEEVRAIATRIASNITVGLLTHVTGLEYCIYGLSTGRSQSFKCSLPSPYPPHSDPKVDVCMNDTSHKFCRIHNLTACLIDGHALNPLP